MANSAGDEFQNAHQKGVAFGTMLSSRQMEQLLGLKAGAFSPMSWLAMQQQAKGATPESIAESFGVSVQDLQELIDFTTEKSGEESMNIWLQGVLSLRTAAQLNKMSADEGWDAIESMAVRKLHNQLSTMKTDGTPAEMLEIATRANKAVRRGRGEGGGAKVAIGVAADGSVNATLRSGELGMLSLRLSPAVKQQMESPAKVIDVTPSKPKVLGQASMLNLEQTRHVGEHGKLSSELDQKAEQADSLNKIFGSDLE